MKQLPKIEVVEVENDGFISLLGKPVLVFCANYIYTGTLTGVNETCIKLENPHIVYETGSFADSKFKDAQKTGDTLFLQMNAIESFGETKKAV